MPKSPTTAEVRLYRWLKRRTTPPDAWQHLTLDELAEKVHCSKSQVSRILPSVVAQLNSIPLDEAEKWVADVMAVRRGHLLDFEIQIISVLRKQESPVSYPRLSKMFGVSEKQIADVCKKFRRRAAGSGTAHYYYGRYDKELIPEAFHDRIPEIIENAGIRRKLSQKHKDLEKEKTKRESFENIFKRLYPKEFKRWY